MSYTKIFNIEIFQIYSSYIVAIRYQFTYMYITLRITEIVCFVA